MNGEHTSEGLEFRFHSKGPGRYFTAAFLAFWLCGWMAGEAFALWALVSGAWAWITGHALPGGFSPGSARNAWMAGTFLVVWLTIWTFGGIAAWATLLQTLWGVDRVIVTGGGVREVHARGPFRSERETPRDEIRRIVAMGHRERLMLETTGGARELTSLGTLEERRAAADAIAIALQLTVPAATAGPAALPREWEIEFGATRERVLVPRMAPRRARAWVLGALAFGALVVVAFVTDRMTNPWKVDAPRIVALALGTLLGIAALWQGFGRMEWVLGSGRLILRKRFGANVRTLGEFDRLRIELSTDEDSDEWFRLEAIPEGAPDTENPLDQPMLRRVGARGRRVIVSRMNDGTSVRELGAWLAAEAGIPFEDATTREAREARLADLLATMQKSGPLGRIAGRLMERAEERRRRAGGA